MEDQKLENLLNLALDATEEEREKSVSLDVGYDAENRTWQVIVRHSGALRQLIAQRYPDVSWQITELSGGYAIVDLPRKDMDKLVRMLQVFYVEKPKQLFFSAEAGRRASCLSSLQTGAGALSGAGVLVAVIDSGVDYFHPDFRTEDGRTRIGSAAAYGIAPSVINASPIIKLTGPDLRSSFVNLFLKSKVARAIAHGGTIPPIITAAIIS